MKNWKIGIRIAAAFTLVVAISVAMGLFAFSRLRAIDERAVYVSGNHLPSVVALSSVNLRVYRVVELMRQHAASNSEQEMTELEARVQELRDANAEDIKRYESLPFGDGEEAIYEKVKGDRPPFWAMIEQIRQVSRKNTPESNAQALSMFGKQLQPITLKMTNDIQAVIDYNDKGSMDGMTAVRAAVESASKGMILCLAFAVVVAIGVTWFLVRGITRPLGMAVTALNQVAEGDLTASIDLQSKDEIGQMAAALKAAVENLRSTMQRVSEGAVASTSSSQQLASASEAIATGAQEQSASLEETSASLEEITATVRQSADNARQASQLASSSKDAAEQGQEVVSNAITAMAEINAASSKISDIISTIDEIAFQTNLLAVNAAVEAARAGEEGRGFAVVAAEVRSLAQRSAAAAKEIKALIQDSQRKVERGTALVNKSGETLQEIVGSVKRVTNIVAEIAAAAAEQSTGIEQVNTAMTQMDQVTQSNSAQTEELSSTAQSLAEQAGRLMELVRTFKLTQAKKTGREAEHRMESLAASAPLSVTKPRVHAPARAETRPHAPIAARVPALATAPAAGGSADEAHFEEF
jgi:methyl-accepting chemotaxis protein